MYSLYAAITDNIVVNNEILIITGILPSPNSVKFNSRPISGTKVMLPPIINTILSILSISVVGKMIFIRLNPGNINIVIDPNKLRK